MSFFYPHLLLLLKNLIPIWNIMPEIYHFFSKLDFLEKQVIFLSLPVIAEEFNSNLEYYVWVLLIFFPNWIFLKNIFISLCLTLWSNSPQRWVFFYAYLLMLKNLIPIWNIMSEFYQFLFTEKQTSHSIRELYVF